MAKDKNKYQGKVNHEYKEHFDKSIVYVQLKLDIQYLNVY